MAWWVSPGNPKRSLLEFAPWHYLGRSVRILSNIQQLSFCRDVDKVHDLMDDIAEQQQVADELTNAISNPIGFGHDVDEVCMHPGSVIPWILIRLFSLFRMN